MVMLLKRVLGSLGSSVAIFDAERAKHVLCFMVGTSL